MCVLELIWNCALESLSVIVPIVMDVCFGIDLESCFGITERDCAYRDGCVCLGLIWNRALELPSVIVLQNDSAHRDGCRFVISNMCFFDMMHVLMLYKACGLETCICVRPLPHDRRKQNDESAWKEGSRDCLRLTQAAVETPTPNA